MAQPNGGLKAEREDGSGSGSQQSRQRTPQRPQPVYGFNGQFGRGWDQSTPTNPPNRYAVRLTPKQDGPRQLPTGLGRTRLFVGSLPPKITEEELKQHFAKYGELTEFFLNAQKGFAFVRLATREAATAAMEELDQTVLGDRTIRVKRAGHQGAVMVEEFSAAVSNELLAEAFSAFGEVERAVVLCDERGLSRGKGIVEFARKKHAERAIEACAKDSFILTRGGRPCRVKKLDPEDDEIGQELRSMKRNAMIESECAVPPHFAVNGTVEHQFAQKWQALYENEQKTESELKAQHAKGRAALIAEQQAAIQKEDLRMRELRELEIKEYQMRELAHQQMLHEQALRARAERERQAELFQRQEIDRLQLQKRMQEYRRGDLLGDSLMGEPMIEGRWAVSPQPQWPSAARRPGPGQYDQVYGEPPDYGYPVSYEEVPRAHGTRTVMQRRDTYQAPAWNHAHVR